MSMDVRDRLKSHLKGLFGFAVSLSRDEEISRDLVQDTVVKAILARNIPLDEKAFRVWLFRILRNMFIDQVRKNHVTYLDPEALEVSAGDDGWMEERQITVLSVRNAFAKLSIPHRDVLALVDVVGMSYAEAASVLDVPVGTIMSRITRARTALLSEIERDNVTSFVSKRKRAKN